jgi:hypothetical protein
MPSSRLALAVCALLLSACTNDTTGPAATGGGAAFAAKIDGTPWTSLTSSTAVTASASGTFTIIGANSAGVGLSLSLFNVAGPGTYELGIGPTLTGGLATSSGGAASWSTPLTGAAGTLTVSTVSVTRIAGTFSFVATPVYGSTTNRTITEGTFDLPVTTTASIAVPDQNGGVFGGTLDGAPWKASTIAFVSMPNSGTMAMGVSNTANNITIILSGLRGVGTYPLNTGVSRYFSISNLSGGKAWGGSNVTSSGSFVITTLTPTRMKGTYNVTLQPVTATGATGTITATGAFDVGLSQ